MKTDWGQALSLMYNFAAGFCFVRSFLFLLFGMCHAFFLGWAADVTAVPSSGTIFVSLANITNLTQLIFAEENWVSRTFPGYKLIEYRHGSMRLDDSKHRKRSVRDAVKIYWAGAARTIVFKYRAPLEQESIDSLWRGCLQMVTRTNATPLALAQCSRIIEEIQSKPVCDVIPYLVEQLGDCRMITNNLFPKGIAVSDLIMSWFMSEIVYSDSGKPVFPSLASGSWSFAGRDQTDVYSEQIRVRVWWNEEGMRLAKCGGLAWKKWWKRVLDDKRPNISSGTNSFTRFQ